MSIEVLQYFFILPRLRYVIIQYWLKISSEFNVFFLYLRIRKLIVIFELKVLEIN